MTEDGSEEEKYYATPKANAAMIVFRKNEANMDFWCAGMISLF